MDTNTYEQQRRIIDGMGLPNFTASADWEQRIAAALNRRGANITAQDFLAVITELAPHTDTLTGAEQDFLLEHTSLTPEDVTPTAVAQDSAALAVARAVAVEQVRAEALSTAQVAELLGTAPANVRRLVMQDRLRPIGQTRSGAHIFPRWQFTAQGILPGVREVLAAFPAEMHPLDVSMFMTTAHETLAGRSPAQWLADGGSPQLVVDLIAELAWI